MLAYLYDIATQHKADVWGQDALNGQGSDMNIQLKVPVMHFKMFTDHIK